MQFVIFAADEREEAKEEKLLRDEAEEEAEYDEEEEGKYGRLIINERILPITILMLCVFVFLKQKYKLHTLQEQQMK